MVTAGYVIVALSTIAAYLFLPFIMIAIHYHFKSEKALLLFSIFNSLLIFVLFSVVHFYTDQIPANSTAAFLWGIVSFHMLKKSNSRLSETPEDFSVRRTVIISIFCTFVASVVLSSYVWILILNSLSSSIYEQGYSDAVIAYEEKIANLRDGMSYYKEKAEKTEDELFKLKIHH